MPGAPASRAIRDAFRERGREPPAESRLSGQLFARMGAAGGRTDVERRERRPTALVCGGTPILLGCLPVVHELGLIVPQDLSLICCDDVDLTRLYRPPITVVRRDMSAIGAMAATLAARTARTRQEPSGHAPLPH